MKKYQWKRKSLLLGLAGLSLASVVPLAVACGNPLTNYNEDEGQYAKQAFLDSFFNSDALQNLLLNREYNLVTSGYQDITKEDVIDFVKTSSLYQGLEAKTKELINLDLANIKLTKSQAGNQLISLETTNSKKQKLVFEHELINHFDDIYTINNKQHEVVVDGSQLKSMDDIFQVIDDIWNIRAKYNNFTPAKYTSLYTLEVPFVNTNLMDRVDSLTTFQNLLGWNFDYKITFDFNGNRSTLNNTNLADYLASLQHLIRKNVNDNALYNFHNNGYYNPRGAELDLLMEKQDYPNYELYNLLSRQHNIFNAFEYQTSKLNALSSPTVIFNDFVFSDFANLPKEVPLVAYQNINDILSEIFHTFASFSHSTTFNQIISQKDFDQDFYYYEKWDQVNDALVKKQFPYLEILNKPTTLPHLEANDQKIRYPNDISNIEYMFAQYVFATDELSSFKKIDYQNSPQFYSQSLMNNLTIEYIDNNNNESIHVNDTILNELIVPKQKFVYAYGPSEMPNTMYSTSKVPSGHAFESRIFTLPKYGYYFFGQGNNNNYIDVAFWKNNDQDYEFYPSYNPQTTLKDDDFDNQLKAEFSNFNFFNPANISDTLDPSDLFNLTLNENMPIGIDDLTYQVEPSSWDAATQVWNDLNTLKPTLGQTETKYYDFISKYTVNLKDNLPQNINFESLFKFDDLNGEDQWYQILEVSKTLTFEIQLFMKTEFEYLADGTWSAKNELWSTKIL